MSENKTIAQQLAQKIAYAKTSVLAREMLYEAHGMINMAHQLGAITLDELMTLNHECVCDGINNPKYF